MDAPLEKRDLDNAYRLAAVAAEHHMRDCDEGYPCYSSASDEARQCVESAWSSAFFALGEYVRRRNRRLLFERLQRERQAPRVDNYWLGLFE